MNQEKQDAEKSKRKARKLTLSEKINLCKRWRTSGLNKSQFCRQNGLSLPTFCEWLIRLASFLKEDSGVGFAPLYPNSKKSILANPEVNCVDSVGSLESAQNRALNLASTSSPIVALEVTLPNQAMVKVKLPLTQVGNLLKDLMHATSALR